MSAPIERPTTATGGLQTASISPAASAARSAIVHGSGARQTVSPTPRFAKLVLRKASSNAGVFHFRQGAPLSPPPAIQTMSGPSPDWW